MRSCSQVLFCLCRRFTNIWVVRVRSYFRFVVGLPSLAVPGLGCVLRVTCEILCVWGAVSGYASCVLSLC